MGWCLANAESNRRLMAVVVIRTAAPFNFVSVGIATIQSASSGGRGLLNHCYRAMQLQQDGGLDRVDLQGVFIQFLNLKVRSVATSDQGSGKFAYLLASTWEAYLKFFRPWGYSIGDTFLSCRRPCNCTHTFKFRHAPGALPSNF